MKKRVIDIAIFAHNEVDNIANCISDVLRQEFESNDDIYAQVLCNGCTDDTYEVAVRSINSEDRRTRIDAVKIDESGKTRTWNRFVSGLRPRCDFVVFVDGDIRIKDAQSVARLVGHLDDISLAAVISKPIAVFGPTAPRWLRTLYDKTKRPIENGICGQFYAVRSSFIRELRLPVPCLVEDGFLAACLKTGLFSHADAPVIRTAPDVSHHFLELSTLREFYEHSVRVELGTEMNAALYTLLWSARSREERLRICAEFAEGRGMDEAFSRFLQQPENRNLVTKILQQFTSGVLTEIRKDPFAAPLRVAKQAYLAAVRARAHRLLKQRTFKW